jgi:hypothetical protein
MTFPFHFQPCCFHTEDLRNNVMRFENCSLFVSRRARCENYICRCIIFQPAPAVQQFSRSPSLARSRNNGAFGEKGEKRSSVPKWIRVRFALTIARSSSRSRSLYLALSRRMPPRSLLLSSASSFLPRSRGIQSRYSCFRFRITKLKGQ